MSKLHTLSSMMFSKFSLNQGDELTINYPNNRRSYVIDSFRHDHDHDHDTYYVHLKSVDSGPDGCVALYSLICSENSEVNGDDKWQLNLTAQDMVSVGIYSSERLKWNRLSKPTYKSTSRIFNPESKSDIPEISMPTNVHLTAPVQLTSTTNAVTNQENEMSDTSVINLTGLNFGSKIIEEHTFVMGKNITKATTIELISLISKIKAEQDALEAINDGIESAALQRFNDDYTTALNAVVEELDSRVETPEQAK